MNEQKAINLCGSKILKRRLEQVLRNQRVFKTSHVSYEGMHYTKLRKL